MKGNASCHQFTEKGRKNYDNIEWAPKKTCEHRRSLGKGRMTCMRSPGAVCPTNFETCVVRND